MAKVRLTLDKAEISDYSISFYNDIFENFKKDCIALGVILPTQFDEIVFCDDVNYYKSYIIYNGNQMPLPLEIENFCKLCFSKRVSFQKLKSDREKEPEIPFAIKKASAVQKVSTICSNARLKISGTTDPNKTASWSVYIDIARSFKNGTASAVEKACLEQEVLLRNISGETVSSFVDKIFQNYEAFFKATTYITGAEKRALLDVESSLADQDLENAILKLTNALNKF